MSSLVVGTPDCPILDVVNVFLESSEELLTEWTLLGRQLSVPEYKIAKIRNELALGIVSFPEALHQLLTSWKSVAGFGATISELITSLETLRLNYVADVLKQKYSTKEVKTNQEKYLNGPSGLREMILSEDKVTIVIISTADVQVTLQKIKDTASFKIPRKVHFAEDEEELRRHARSSENPNSVYVLTATSSSSSTFEDLLHAIVEIAFGQFVIIAPKAAEYNFTLHNVNVRKIIDTTKWSDLSKSFQQRILQRNVRFQKREVGFQEIIKQYSTIAQTPPLKGVIEESLLLALINNTTPCLTRETFPAQISYYIPRNIISTRKLCSKALFQRSSQDIFVFTGIEKAELSRHCRNFSIASSQQQLRDRSINVSHMVLDFESDYDKLRTKSRGSVHWVHHKDGGFSWVRTLGNISAIQKARNMSEQVKLTEDELVNIIINENSVTSSCAATNFKSPILLTDSPGMGKSILLAKLGTTLQEKFPERLVVFFPITELVASSAFGVKRGGKWTKEEIDDYLANQCSENGLGRLILKEILNSGGEVRIDLMLDGFDEVHVDQRKLAYALLEILQTRYKSLRLWLTSRPHMTQEWEVAFQVLSYRIAPFELSEQVKCLVSLWTTSSTNSERLELYAKLCLQHLQEELVSKNHKIAGIPLQCRMIAELHEQDAQDYAGAESQNHYSNSLPAMPYHSVTDLYQATFDKKYEKYVALNCNSKREPWSKQKQGEEHIRLALSLLFQNSPVVSRDTSTKWPDENILQLGIIQSSFDGYTFLHRTFAEFFVAHYGLKSLAEGTTVEDFVLEFILGSVLATENRASPKPGGGNLKPRQFKNEVIGFFLSNLMSDTEPDIIPRMARVLQERLTVEGLSHLVSAAIYHDLPHLFETFESTDKFQNNVGIVINKTVIFTAVRTARKALLDKVLRHASKSRRLPLSQLFLLSDEMRRITLLDAAIRSREFPIVDYLLKEHGFESCVRDNLDLFPDLLYHCIRKCKSGSNASAAATEIDMIQEKIQTMRTLVSINPNMLNAWSNILPSRINFNPELMQELISNVVHIDGVAVANRCKTTILHWICQFAGPKDLLRIVEKIPPEKAITLVSTESVAVDTPLFTVVQRQGVDLRLLIGSKNTERISTGLTTTETQ